eukprot:CAMPEP_0174255918 /NCGR_PEP_ID=MMETSP0439-20130205/5202_1 /TAXON_ID=0 /ORGANISM="Stereomyxa ramosa, Strain Chinc5" /LENGTH=372 /DNA_ID=CAMNT_0015338303 /DNA_START=569 /DNA_END=1687 /DNA_ORIENTATION=-
MDESMTFMNLLLESNVFKDNKFLRQLAKYLPSIPTGVSVFLTVLGSVMTIVEAGWACYGANKSVQKHRANVRYHINPMIEKSKWLEKALVLAETAQGISKGGFESTMEGIRTYRRQLQQACQEIANNPLLSSTVDMQSRQEYASKFFYFRCFADVGAAIAYAFTGQFWLLAFNSLSAIFRHFATLVNDYVQKKHLEIGSKCKELVEMLDSRTFVFDMEFVSAGVAPDIAKKTIHDFTTEFVGCVNSIIALKSLSFGEFTQHVKQVVKRNFNHVVDKMRSAASSLMCLSRQAFHLAVWSFMHPVEAVKKTFNKIVYSTDLALDFLINKLSSAFTKACELVNSSIRKTKQVVVHVCENVTALVRKSLQWLFLLQ